MWKRSSQMDKILHTHSYCNLTCFSSIVFLIFKEYPIKMGFNTEAVCCSGSSQLYSVTALDHYIYNTSAFSPESNRCICRTLPCWNISKERSSLASGITAYWHTFTAAFYATNRSQGSPEMVGLGNCPSHLLTCCHEHLLQAALFPMAHQIITWIAPLVSGQGISQTKKRSRLSFTPRELIAAWLTSQSQLTTQTLLLAWAASGELPLLLILCHSQS